MTKETETNEYSKRPKLFKGKIKSLSIGNYPCFFTTEPKYGEDLEQRVTITADGHLKVYRKIYEGGWLQSVKAENVTKSKKISVEDTMKIFNRISRYFSKDYDSCVACDGGSWELRLTNTEGEVFRYWGGTTGIDHRSSLSRLSKLIRQITGLEYVLGFDEDTQYGFLLLNKIRFVGAVEKTVDGKKVLYRKFYFRALLPDGRTVNSTRLLTVGEDEKAAYREFEVACLREGGKKGSPLRLAAICRDLTLTQVMDLHRDSKADYEKATTQYHHYLRKRIDEALGAKKIRDIQLWQLDEFSRRLAKDPNRLTGKPLSRVTVHRVQAFLVQIFHWAYKKGYIDADPTVKMERFKKVKSRVTAPKQQAVDELADMLMKEDIPGHYRIFAFLALFTGMRREEILGLRWSDIDFSGDVIHVRQARAKVPGAGVSVKDVKNEFSTRDIPLSRRLKKMLLEWDRVIRSRKRDLRMLTKVFKLMNETD